MNLRRAFSVASPAILFIGCDLFTQAYQDGYNCGYFAVDSYYNCAAGCEREQERREEEADAWNEACFLPVHDFFDDQPSLDAADERCQGSDSQAGVVICTDEGQVIGSHPGGCRPFDPPALGVPVRESYDCPNAVGDESLLCLCCSGVARPACDLPGGFCRADADCCSGACDAPADGGFIEGFGPDGGPLPRDPTGTCD